METACEYFCKKRSHNFEIFKALGHRMKKPSWYIADIAVFIAEVAVTWANQQHQMDKTLGLPPRKKKNKHKLNY